MRRVLTGGAPTATILEGVAEALPVGDRSQDAVLAHSSWHWVDPDRAVAEAARVLRPGGRLGALWTRLDGDVDWVGELWERLRPHRERRRSGAGLRELRLPAAARFGPVEGPRVIRFNRRFTRAQLLGLAGTYSGVAARPPSERAALLAQIRVALDADPRLGAPAGVEVPMLTHCWRATR